MIRISQESTNAAASGSLQPGLSGRLANLRHDLRRHPILVVLILGLLLIIGLGGYSAIQGIRAEYQLRAAQQALEQPDLARAEAHLALCLALSPQNTEAHFLAAQTARRL